MKCCKYRFFILLIMMTLFLPINILKVKAENPWVNIGTCTSDVPTSNAFTFEPSKYKYRIYSTNYNCTCPYAELMVTNEEIQDNTDYLYTFTYMYYNDNIEVTDSFISNLTPNKRYRLFIASYSGGCSKCDYASSYIKIVFQKQLLNVSPTITLTAPTPNSPLQPIGTNVKEVA